MTHTHPPNTNMIARKMSARMRNEQKKERKQGFTSFNLACIQVPPPKKNTLQKSHNPRETLQKTMTQVLFFHSKTVDNSSYLAHATMWELYYLSEKCQKP